MLDGQLRLEQDPNLLAELPRSVLIHCACTIEFSRTLQGLPQAALFAKWTLQMVNSPSKHNTGAVLVAYYPDEGLMDRLRAIEEQVSSALIVDNTPTEDRRHWLADTAALPGVELVLNDQNRGVAAALNQGLEWARERGLEWLLTLDQDTRPYADMVSTMGLVYDSCPERDRVAMIGSNYIERCWKQPFWHGESKGPEDWVEVVFLITSGSLVSLRAVETVGGFRDEFFIDLVDSEFCLRARKKGFSLILAKKPLMDHGIGEPVWCRFLWRRLTTANHSPVRHYYFTRNYLTLMREYLPTERAAMLATIKPRLKEIVLVLCCEREKWPKIRAMMLGVLDSFRKRMGLRPEIVSDDQ